MKNNSGEQVSVVVVNFNSGAYLERCIRSLLLSDITLEICVVDNCSSDDSIEKLKGLEEQLKNSGHSLIEIQNERNCGFSSAVNIGAAATSSNDLFILNPDCFVHSHTVRLLKEALSLSDNAGVVGPLVFNENGTEQVGCRRNEPTMYRSAIKALGLSKWFEGVDLRYQPIPEDVQTVDAISGCAMMFRRERFEKIGGMDERYFLHCEDLDICRRMRDAGYEVRFVPSVSLFHQQGASGGASDQRIENLKHEGMMAYYLQHYGQNSPVAVLLVKFFVYAHLWVKRARSFAKEQLAGRGLQNATEDQSNRYLPDLPGPNSAPVSLVTGANSDVGDFFLKRAGKENLKCIAVFRNNRMKSEDSCISWMAGEYFEKVPADDMPLFDQWVNLAPIWTIERFLAFFKRDFPRKIVALSSTSVEAKSSSDNAQELKIVMMLKKGEERLFEIANKHSIRSVVLRPTLIYGGPRNRNINLIALIIRKTRMFPIVGHANGKRQPVHADDVAAACQLALADDSVNGAFSIAGAEILTFREMVVRVFESLGQSPKFLSCPKFMVKGVLSVASHIPVFKGLSAGLVARLQTDQVFSNTDAIEAFGYSPRSFQPKNDEL